MRGSSGLTSESYFDWLHSLTDLEWEWKADNDATLVELFDVSGEGILKSVFGYANQEITMNVYRDGSIVITNMVVCDANERFSIPLDIAFLTRCRVYMKLGGAGAGKFGSFIQYK